MAGESTVDQGEGDSVFAAFDSAAAAIAAVTRFQEALAAEPWPTGVEIRVRVGVHAGEVIARDGNLFGSTVNRCADGRLRGLASGGQVLLSATAFELVRDRLSDGVRVIDLGEHRMKDLARAEHAYQLVMPGPPGDFPPLASLDRGAHNLAVQTSSFLGRTTEIAELVDLVRKERLVTIVGFGGMGKTRLALQVAAELADGSDDGVWFVDLSAVTDPTRVPSLIGTVLGIGESAGGMLPGLVAGLRKRRLLLVLDNLEQLLPEAALLVDQVLRAAPEVRILTTSREPLRVRGEQEYQLAPLPVPPQPTAGDPWTEAELESVSTYDAVRLFLTRAAAVRREFVLTPANAGAVAAICARLDGMPLALELAAARTRVFAPESLLPRLERALTVLTGGGRDLPPRQQTLRATIAWSYDALDPDQRGLLYRLSIFPGTFTFDAAEQICGPATRAGAADLDVLDGLSVLVDRSLVNHYPAVESGREDRYSLLVSIRDYGAEQLTEGSQEILADRHAAYYAALMTRPPEMFHPDEDPMVQRDDLHNLRAAVAHAQAGADDELEVNLARFASALTVRGRGEEARAVLDHALGRARRATPEQVELLFSRTLLESVSFRKSDARDWATRFLAEARAVGDPSLLVMALALNMRGSRAGARRLFAEGEALLESMPARGTYYARRSVERAWDGVLDNSAYGDPERVEAALRRALAHSSEPAPSMWSMSLGWALLRYGRSGARHRSPLGRPEPPPHPAGGVDLPVRSPSAGYCPLAARRPRP